MYLDLRGNKIINFWGLFSLVFLYLVFRKDVFVILLMMRLCEILILIFKKFVVGVFFVVFDVFLLYLEFFWKSVYFIL